MSEIVPTEGTPEIGEVLTITTRPEFIYVVEFSTGILKVGFSNEPNQRIAAHRVESRRFRADVLRTWVSPAHEGGKANEHALIAWCSRSGINETGNEYFRDVEFDDVVAYAKSLSYPPVPAPRALQLPPRSMFTGGVPRKIYADGMELAVTVSMQFWDALLAEIGDRSVTVEQLQSLVDGAHSAVIESIYNPAVWAQINPKKAS